ncbi:MAG TPA: type II secretion system F family protein [Gammaproteobacteria bacterium]
MAQAAAVKKIAYSWEGTDKNGNRIKGDVQSPNEALAKAELRRQGINVAKIGKKKGSLRKGKITPKDIAILSRQLATMMSSGVPLVQSFEIIGKGHDNPAMRELVGAVRADLESGTPLARALSNHPQYFDALTCNLVEAGEAAGILEELLGKIATYKEKTEAIKAKVKKALFYPTAIIIVAFIITAILMIFVIPQFASLFKGFGADLPAMTLFVMNLSDAFVSYWWAIFGGLFAAGYSFISAKKKSVKFQESLERLSLKVPIIGNILNKAAIARYARTLSTMFAAGVPLVETLDSVAKAVGNVVYREAIFKMRDSVSTGVSLTDSMNQANVFPSMVTQMVAIGEEAGSLDTMLAKVADFYEEEVDNAVDALSSLLEPIIMAVLGVVIGGLVIAMYMPIFKMGQVV